MVVLITMRSPLNTNNQFVHICGNVKMGEGGEEKYNKTTTPLFFLCSIFIERFLITLYPANFSALSLFEII